MYLYKQRFTTPPAIYKAFRWFPYNSESERNLENNIPQEFYKWNPYDDKPLILKIAPDVEFKGEWDEEVPSGSWIVIIDENIPDYGIFTHDNFKKTFEFYGPQTS